MSIGRRGDVLRQFHTLFAVGSVAGLSDGELLDRSITRSGPTAELAFAALVERHGPMVLRVCRKALGDPHEAHDAFQSTFLILARKAESIRTRDSVASWLHGVALRVSAASRASIARRRKHERARAGMAPRSTWLDDPVDLGPVLHDEVGRLPSRYREAVVLCYLEGKSYEEAAGSLHVPVGTIKSRLSWARERLRERLAARGLAPAAGAIATLLAAESAQASVPLPSLWAETTAEAAIRFAASSRWTAIGSGMVPGPAAVLAKGVIHAMVWNKIKLAGMAGAAMLAASGLGVVAQQPSPVAASAATDPTSAPAPAQASQGDRLDKLESKIDRLISVLEKTVTQDPLGPASAPPALFRSMNSTAAAPAGRYQRPQGVTSVPAGAAIAGLPALATTAEIAKTVDPTTLPAAATSYYRAGASLAPFGSNDRLEKIEARLAALEKQMEKLSGSEPSIIPNTVPATR